jgi:hypothetical protein
MKAHFTKTPGLLMLFVFLSRTLAAAVTLSVSPSSTSNNYNGVITLQIGGLTNGESVVVQRFLDFNSNGVIDPGEPMIDTFPISDGGVSIIGGATNYSVPYDLNPTNGAIKTTLNFALPMNFENITAPSIYQLISPTGHFAPVTASFVVTNGTQNQTISGTVFRGATPVANALVGVSVQPSGGLLAVVVSDNTGHYALKLPVGVYQMLTLVTNTFFDRSVAPIVTLTNGMSSTNNLFVTNGTVTISGKVYDSTSTNNGLGAVWLTLQSGNYMEALFTGSNGTYSTAVNPGFWTPDLLKERLARRGYVVLANLSQVNTTTGSVANVNIPLPRGNALFYGRVTDGSNDPFANVIFDGNDGNNGTSQYDLNGYSDTNGNYGVAVLADSNSWYAAPDSIENVQFANDIVSQGTNVVFSPGQAVRQDFTVLPANGHISGRVLDNSGNPVVGVEVDGSANIGGNNFSSSSVDTDTNGYYTLGVASGSWSVFFGASINNKENPLTHNLEDLFGPYSVSVPPTNAVQNITLYPIGVAVLANGAMSSPGEFDLNVYGEINVTYTLEFSPDLTNWSPVYSFQLTGNPFPVSDTSATNTTGFYRVVLVP